MTARTASRGWALVSALGLIAGCSGDAGSGGQGAGADRALAQRDCYLGLQVPGVSHTGYACSGTDTTSSVSGLEPSNFEPALSVSLTLAEPPEIGDLILTSLTLDIPEAGVSQRWEAPVAACNATAIASAVDPDFGWTYFRIDITCSAPAVPIGDNSGDPIELGDFSIVTFFSLD